MVNPFSLATSVWSLVSGQFLFSRLQGAQEIIQELPHEYVSPYDLKEVSENGGEQEELVSLVRIVSPLSSGR